MLILYIEDDPDAISPIQRITAYLGYDLTIADTVESGLARIQEQPDLVLVDMILPDGDAITFIRETRKTLIDLPIFVVTGYAIDGEREACFEAGCTDYFIKPVDVNQLIALFKKYAGDALE